MEHLRAAGWQTLTLDQLLAGHVRGEWPAGAFALTFDDGFENFAEHGLPILEDCHFLATLFLVADWVGRTNDWPGQSRWVTRRPLLDWPVLRAIADAGIEIGAHSLSHPHLSRLSTAEMEREIVKCKLEIEDRIGRSVDSFAYPYGELSPLASGIVGDHYRAGFSTRLGFASESSHTTAFERIEMFYLRKPCLFTAIETGWFGTYLNFRRWLRELRRIERKAT